MCKKGNKLPTWETWKEEELYFLEITSPVHSDTLSQVHIGKEKSSIHTGPVAL